MAVWGKTADVYTLPTVRLTSDEAPWLADAAVVSWSVERELVGSTLPGNVRARTGLSIGDASVVVASTTGRQLTPWASAAAEQVGAGAALRLFAEADDGDQLDLGAWRAARPSGALADQQVQVDLDEIQYQGRLAKQAVPARSFPQVRPVDPVWMIARLAEQAGFYGAPPAIASDTILDCPLDGSAVDPDAVDGESAGWTGLPDGIVGTDGAAFVKPANAAEVTSVLASGASVFLTLNVVGSVQIVDSEQLWEVVVDATAGTISVRNTLTAAAVSTSYTPGLSTDWPTRVQVELKRTLNVSVPSPGTYRWSDVSVRARSGPSATWSAWATESTDSGDLAASSTIHVVAGQRLSGGALVAGPDGNVAAFQATRTAHADLWRTPNARLTPLGGQLSVPFLPPTLDAWTGIQTVAGANLAAVHVDRDGRLTVLDRDDLAGAGTPGTTTLVDEEWTDLGWSLDPDDSADRLVVTYRTPAVTQAAVGSSSPAPEFWRSEEIIALPPGNLVTVLAEAESRAVEGLYGTFVNAADLSADPTLASQYSVISVFNNAAGAGTPITDGSVMAQAFHRGPALAEITLRNNNATTVYLVDANGAPCLILRGRTVGTFDTDRQVERGAAEADASRPLTIDLGAYVQTADDAEEVADYLWSRVTGAGLWKASGVRCRLDWSHDIGKVLRLLHARTGLEVKALITKVSYAGAPGEIAQTLDLVLLPWTWADFDDAYDTFTWDTWDAAWAAPDTWTEFDADPLNLGG